MTEKEEITQNNRIINAEKYKRRIKKGRIYIDVRDKKLNCLLCKVYSRQEAIEKMAKGMYLLTNPEDTKYANFYNCYFFELAEAALNALLGER